MTIWAVIAGGVVVCGLLVIGIGIGCADPAVGRRSARSAALRGRLRRLRRLRGLRDGPEIVATDRTGSHEDAKDSRTFRRHGR